MTQPRCGADVCLACEVEALEFRRSIEVTAEAMSEVVSALCKAAPSFKEGSESFRRLAAAIDDFYRDEGALS